MQTPILMADKTLAYGEVHVAFSGICGSDIHRACAGAAYQYPLIMGHEFSGEVEEGFEGCRCLPCQTGDYAQCLNYSYLGSRCDGGFAEYVYVPEANLFPIHGSWNSRVVPRGRDEWSTVLKAMDRKLKIAPLISHTPDLADGAEVFRGIADGSLGPYRKIVFKVGTK